MQQLYFESRHQLLSNFNSSQLHHKNESAADVLSLASDASAASFSLGNRTRQPSESEVIKVLC